LHAINGNFFKRRTITVDFPVITMRLVRTKTRKIGVKVRVMNPIPSVVICIVPTEIKTLGFPSFDQLVGIGAHRVHGIWTSVAIVQESFTS